MGRSAITTYIARLTDSGSLSGQIVWRTTTIGDARRVLERVGLWQPSPDGSGGDILLGDTAHVVLFEDAAPFHADDDLNERIENGAPSVAVFSIGPRGGIRRAAL